MTCLPSMASSCLVVQAWLRRAFPLQGRAKSMMAMCHHHKRAGIMLRSLDPRRRLMGARLHLRMRRFLPRTVHSQHSSTACSCSTACLHHMKISPSTVLLSRPHRHTGVTNLPTVDSQRSKLPRATDSKCLRTLSQPLQARRLDIQPCDHLRCSFLAVNIGKNVTICEHAVSKKVRVLGWESVWMHGDVPIFGRPCPLR